MAENRAETCCCVRGVKYSIRLDITPDARIPFFSIDVSAIDHPRRWTGVFDEDMVDRLTEEAGVVKQFLSFTAMLRAALLRLSKSVCMDILSPSALNNITNASRNSQTRTSRSRRRDDPSEETLESADRLYLILTHRSEFEKCSYPLPLVLKSAPRSPSRSRRKSNRDERDRLPFLAQNGFNDQNIALYELQVEIKTLREENQKLRACKEVDSKTAKEACAKMRQEKECLKRQLEIQLSKERTAFQQEMQSSKRQQAQLTKNLGLAKREIDSLKVQVRRLQAESASYKRNSANRTSNPPVPPRKMLSTPSVPRSQPNPVRRAISPSGYESPYRRPSYDRADTDRRSRSFSPKYQPSHCGQSSRFSVLRSQYSDTAVSGNLSKGCPRTPRTPLAKTRIPYCPSFSNESLVSGRNFRPSSRTRLPRKQSSSPVDAMIRRYCSPDNGPRTSSQNLMKMSESLHRKFNISPEGDRIVSRCPSIVSDVSIKKILKQKCDPTSNLTGAKFRALLGRLQHLSEEFPDKT